MTNIISILSYCLFIVAAQRWKNRFSSWRRV